MRRNTSTLNGTFTGDRCFTSSFFSSDTRRERILREPPTANGPTVPPRQYFRHCGLFKLAAETGARAGERYALTVDDLLFDLNVIYINKSMYRQKTGSPKTKNATRWVNVKPYVMEMLKEHLNGRTEGWVFQSRPKTGLVNCTVLNKHLHPLLRKPGLKRGGMHGFRHYRVRALVMAGTPIEVIKKWVGHGSEEMIRRYAHLRPDFMRDELARVPDFAPKNASKIVEIAPVAPQLAVAV
jgi:integrase